MLRKHISSIAGTGVFPRGKPDYRAAEEGRQLARHGSDAPKFKE